MKYKKQSWAVILSILFVLLSQSFCSKPVADVGSFVNCVNGTNPLPIGPEFKFPGDLLFLKRDRSELLAYNGETHQFTSIFRMPDKVVARVSPLSNDGKTLVISYQDSSNMKSLLVILLSPQGSTKTDKTQIPPLTKNQEKTVKWGSVDWANSNYLQGTLFEEGITGDELSEIWFLNPYKLEWKSLASLLPDLKRDDVSGVLFSPDLTRVLYVDSKYHLEMYDLQRKANLWKYDDYDGISPIETSVMLSGAIWSPDGEILALPLANEDRVPISLMLDKDGGIINSIYFGNYQFGYSWSKDGQLLAFYEHRCTTIDSIVRCDSKPVIRVISAKDGLLRDLCALDKDILPTQGIQNSAIVWSPNQQFLAYSSTNHKTGHGGILLQKLNDPQIRIIESEDDSLILLGWSQEHWEKARP
jgi:hypothetical protein